VDQTQREFLVEIEELVEQIFADLEQLRHRYSDGRLRRELIDRIFRRVHSVKGSAASCGLEVVSQIAHEFENLLDAARAGRIILDAAVLDTCENATDALSESLSLAASGIVEPSRRALFDQLRGVVRGNTREPGGDTEAILNKIPFEIWQSLTDAEKQRVVSIVEEGSPVWVVTTSFDIANFDEEFFRLKEKLAECGEVISTSPTVDDERPDKINFRVLYGSAANAVELDARVIDFANVTFKEIAKAGGATPSDVSKQGSPGVPRLPSVSSLSNFVHTDLEKLDRLISSTHELFRTTSNALDLALSQKQMTKEAGEELLKLGEHIRSSFLGVEDELINLRMVSLGPTLQRAARAGRAAARVAGKEIDFEIVGADLRLDKLLADAIADPLIHLVRNAVDHGIETAEVRVQAGKSMRGTVRIEATSEGSQFRLRVTDDGRGIDPFLISEAAMRLGIVETESALDFEHSLRLIFRPGFTTLDAVSDISGRGVGLDVVETSVEQVGGELRVSSKPMQGTTFEIRLPVTFGLLAATVISSGSSRYCVPASHVIVIQHIDAGAPVVAKKKRKRKEEDSQRSGSNQVPSVPLRELLGQPAQKDSREQSRLMICEFSDERTGAGGNGPTRVGIIVDKVEGNEEVLVRNLGRYAGRWYGVAGATELRDGSVALVLDLPRLISGTNFSL
jgi:two-component system chemotaxis sensor kinase CheA